MEDAMNDTEIESLLEDAGYGYDLASGQFITQTSQETEIHSPKDVADELDIPVDDIIRWVQEQNHADEAAMD
jgi:hypothetical protein